MPRGAKFWGAIAGVASLLGEGAAFGTLKAIEQYASGVVADNAISVLHFIGENVLLSAGAAATVIVATTGIVGSAKYIYDRYHPAKVLASVLINDSGETNPLLQAVKEGYDSYDADKSKQIQSQLEAVLVLIARGKLSVANTRFEVLPVKDWQQNKVIFCAEAANLTATGEIRLVNIKERTIREAFKIVTQALHQATAVKMALDEVTRPPVLLGSEPTIVVAANAAQPATDQPQTDHVAVPMQ